MKEQVIKVKCVVTYSKEITVPESWDEYQIDEYIHNTYDEGDFTMYDPDNIRDVDWDWA